MTSGHPIEESLNKLALLREQGRGLLMTEPDPGSGWLSVADLATESVHMDGLFKRIQAHYKTQKLRPPAMFWFGHYAYTVEIIIFACFLIERRVPDLSLDQIHMRFDERGDIENMAWTGRAFAALPDDPHARHPDCTVLPTREALRGYMQERLIANFTPVVDSISKYSSLGRPGLWEIAADYSAFAFTWLGELMGDESLGVEESRLFSAHASRLSVRRDFIPIEHLGHTHYMLDRTSCCLYFKVQGGSYCHSCPHRPLEERIRMMKEHMEEAAEAAGNHG